MAKKLFSREQAFFSLGILVGLSILALARFISYQPPTHYHANFAVFINGERDKFDGPGFYEAVTACTTNDTLTPAHRAHMHNHVNNVTHVHEPAVTWGMFFENIGYSIGAHHLATNTKIYSETDSQAVRFILNGEELDSVTNKVIESEDQLLVSVDKPNSNLSSQIKQIANSAGEYNAKPDPASCSGASNQFLDRLQSIYK